MSKPLSRDFLLGRGECCGNGCKNCPFYPRGKKGSKEVFEMPTSVDCRPSCSVSTMQDGNCICYMDYKLNKK